MATYYIKILGRQELGSPTPDGHVSRGRYFLISKRSGDFFPPLSTTELNDVIMLPVIAPESKNKVYCSYVYHNSKHFPGRDKGQPRDEYRLYLNRDIDPKRGFFTPGDIVVFTKIKTVDLVPVYEIFMFRETSRYYFDLKRIIQDSSFRGGHALFEGSLSFIKSEISIDKAPVVIPKEVYKEIQKKQKEIEVLEEQHTEYEVSRGASLFNSVSFRDFILFGYNNKCAVTRTSICYDALINLEAAHIKPKSHRGSFLPCNGMALSRDMHWAFDKGMFSISDDYKVIVHEDVKETLLGKYDNTEILIPEDDFFKPEKKYLKYHRDNIFGLFKYSGLITAVS